MRPHRLRRLAADVPGHRRWFVLGLVVAVQLVALYLPGAHGPTTDLPLDKVAHVALFAVVAAVAVWAQIPVLAVIVLLVTQTVASELVQQFLLPDRGGEWADVAADLFGVAVGIAAGVALCRDPGR